jgi:hypothetical protein
MTTVRKIHITGVDSIEDYLLKTGRLDDAIMRQGVLAYCNGLPIDASPYTNDAEFNVLWQCGYRLAATPQTMREAASLAWYDPEYAVR